MLTLLDKIIRTHPSLSYLAQLLPKNAPDPLPFDLTTSPHLTVFAPSNQALQNAFDDMETRYLESDYGVEAIGRIMAGGVILGVGKREKVGWRDTWEKTEFGSRSAGRGVNSADVLVSISGGGVRVDAPSNGSLIVNGTEAEVVDIFASNGKRVLELSCYILTTRGDSRDAESTRTRKL
jgi:hypothetical protein